MELLKTFHLVAALKSMARAAEQLNIQRSTVTKHIQQLEHRLGGVKLMDRYPLGITLTESGELYFLFVNEFLGKESRLKSQLKVSLDGEVGHLKLFAMASFGMEIFSHHIEEFQARYPQITIEIIYSDRKNFEFSSVNSGVYVGLTNKEPSDKSSYIWKKIGSYYLYPYGHSSYLQKYGTPTSIKDLDKHKHIGYRFGVEYSYIDYRQINWTLYTGRAIDNPREAKTLTDDAIACRSLAINSGGIAMLPKYLVKGTDLVQLLPDLYEPSMDGTYNAYIAYPQHLKNFGRVKLFKQFISEKILQEDGVFE